MVEITEAHPDMDWDDSRSRPRSCAASWRGNCVVGPWASLTSRGKMKQMGVDTPVFGWPVDSLQRAGRREIGIKQS